MFTNLWQDLRYALRILAKNPGFTSVSALTLAVGIGANTTIFGVVNALLLQPLPFNDPDRVMRIWEHRLQPGFDQTTISPAEFLRWKEQSRTFTHLAAMQYPGATLTTGGEPLQVSMVRCTATFLSAIGARPVQGRNFALEEDTAGHDRVVLISQRLWHQRFGSDPHIVGSSVSLDNQSYSVIGVLPRGLDINGKTDILAPLVFTDNDRVNYGNHFLESIGRLAPGVSREQARAELDALDRSLAKEFPRLAGDSVKVLPLRDDLVGETRPEILVLMAAVGFVLLIACANMANLLLVRAAGRQKELAIRVAIGARRSRIIRQLLTESLVLAVLGGACGILLAVWGLDLLIAFAPDTPRIDEVTMGTPVWVFSLAVTLIAGVAFGLAPAWQASRTDVDRSLKEAGRSPAPAGQRVLSAFVIGEVALALVLLVGSGLLLRSFVRLLEVNAGFNPADVLTADVSLPVEDYRETDKQLAFYRQLIQRIEALPGVRSAGLVNAVPLSGNNSSGAFTIEGHPQVSRDQTPNANRRIVTPHYFHAMGIPLLKGRLFTETDEAAKAPVAIINETMARKFWPNQDPIGKRFKPGGAPPATDPWLTIVGMVGDVHHRALNAPPRQEMYLLFSRQPARSMSIIVRAASNPAGLAAPVRNAVWALDKTLSTTPTTMEEVVAASVAPRRMTVWLVSLFGFTALALAAIGIYGVMAYSVTQRRYEIGVRMAIGAQRRDVLRLIIGRGLTHTAAGLIIGAATALAVTRGMSSLLFEVGAADPVTYVAIAGLLGTVALLASYIPARRAMQVDPIIALRAE